MAAYLVRRLLGSIAVLFGSLGLIFVVVRLAPGDPAQMLAGTDASPAQLETIRSQMGLDRPLPVQYLAFLARLAHGDFGHSYYTHEPAMNSVLSRIPVTLELALLTIIVAVVSAGFLGILAASRRNSPVDGVLRVVTLLGMSVPNFWLGLLLILLFGLYIPDLLPASGWTDFSVDPLDNLQHTILPVTVLSLPAIAILFRSLRVSMLDVLNRDYVLYARAMGIRQSSVLRRVALPNAVIPTTTVAGLILGYLIGGSLIVETIFSLPGVGQLVVYAFSKRDYPVAIACVMLIALGFIAINFVVDVMYAYFSPRIRELYSRKLSVREA